MEYTEFLNEEKKKPEAGALFLANKTNNIFGINHLVEKNFIPAVLKRLEIAAANNDSDKVLELKDKAISLFPDNLKTEATSHIDLMIEEKTPKSIIKNDRKVFKPM